MHNDSQRRVRAAIRNGEQFEGLSLLVRRRWFADEAVPYAPTDDTDGEQSPAGAQNTDTAKTVPYERFAQVNKQMREMQKQLDAYSKAQTEAQAAEEKRKAEEAAKRGEFEQLYTSEKSKREQVEAQLAELAQYRTMVENDIKAKLEGLPEHIRDLLKPMTPLQQAEYLTKHGDTLKPNKAPNLDGGERGAAVGKPSGRPNPIGRF